MSLKPLQILRFIIELTVDATVGEDIDTANDKSSTDLPDRLRRIAEDRGKGAFLSPNDVTCSPAGHDQSFDCRVLAQATCVPPKRIRSCDHCCRSRPVLRFRADIDELLSFVSLVAVAVSLRTCRLRTCVTDIGPRAGARINLVPATAS